jgi:hypothetical protein
MIELQFSKIETVFEIKITEAEIWLINKKLTNKSLSAEEETEIKSLVSQFDDYLGKAHEF